MSTTGTICIDIWSDYVCPFCYLEEPVLQRIKGDYGDNIVLEWRAFELRPEPVPTLDPKGEYLRTTWARAVYPMAAERGMTLRLPPVQPRSRRALEAAEFARAQGRYDDMHHALFRAFFEQGRDLCDLQVLTEIAATVGLDPAALRSALEQGSYTERVRHDQQLAHDLGIDAVPALLIRRCSQPLETAQLLNGAQPYQVVRRVVDALLQGRTIVYAHG